jgi:hemerythrin-like domain-containing protein
MGDSMKDPVKVLFQEHEVILTAIDIAKQADKFHIKGEAAYLNVVSSLINFFQSYADKYHHYKEEKILFPEMNKKNELLEEGVIKEMLENHEDFRDMIKSIEAFLNKKDYMRAQQQLNIYTEALLDHIAVENDEVFQMAKSLFDKDELEKLYFRFDDCDREIGEQKKTELINQLNEIKGISDIN